MGEAGISFAMGDVVLSALVVFGAVLFLLSRFLPDRWVPGRKPGRPVAQTPQLKGALARGVAQAEANRKRAPERGQK